MKPIWYILFVIFILILQIIRMAKSVWHVLIAISIIALIALIIRMVKIGKIKINVRFASISKTIISCIVLSISIVYITMMTGFSIYKVITLGEWQGIIVLGSASIIISISWYLNRWRRWWIKFLKTFIPKDKIYPGDWSLREKYFSTFDYASNARYSLRAVDGTFSGHARVWLDKQHVDVSAKLTVHIFEDLLKRKNIEASIKLEHIPGCIYADIIAETNYKSIDSSSKQTSFRAAFYWLYTANYRGDYYVRYNGELGTILFECNSDNTITRAIRTEPREEFYLDNTCDFLTDEARDFIEKGVDWSDGTCSLITKKEFFTLWHELFDYKDKEIAFSFFLEASLIYFAAVANDDKNEQTNSRWDIENAAKYLIDHNETEIMIELLNLREETMYWAARLFSEVLPAETQVAAMSIIESCDNPLIVTRTKRLLSQWKKEGKICTSS